MKQYTAQVLLLLACSASAFQRLAPSSFTGRASSVASRDELTTELSCPPARTNNLQRGNCMSMPPFLKKLGLKKPEKPLFGGEEEKSEDGGVATAERPKPYLETLSSDNGDDKKAVATVDEECVIAEEEELSESQKLLKQVKEAGTAGIISYALWELGFWAISVPVCSFAFYEATGHFPNFSDKEDMAKLGAEAFAFVNFARFAVPLRIGLALSTTPWIDENIVKKFIKKDENNCEEPEA